MECAKEYLALLAKIMQEEMRTENCEKGTQISDQLYELVHTQLDKTLRKTEYPGSSAVIRRLDGMQEQIEWLMRCRKLIGKACVRIQGEYLNHLFSFFKEEFGAKKEIQILTRRAVQIPFLVIPNDTFCIEALNYANNRIKITAEEYELLLQGSNASRIELKRIVQLFIVKVPMHTLSCCMLFDNIYRDGEKKFYCCLHKNIHFAEYFGSSNVKHRKSRKSAIPDAVCCFEKDECLAKNDPFCARIPLVKQHDLTEYLRDTVKAVLYGFWDEYQLIRTQIQAYFETAIAEEKKVGHNIVDDVVRAEVGSEQLQELRWQAKNHEKNLIQQWKAVQQVLDTLDECVEKIVEVLQNHLSEDKVVPRRVLDMIFDRLFCGVPCVSNTDKEVLNRLMTVGYPNCELINTYIQQFQQTHEPISYFEFEDTEWEKAKIYIALCDVETASKNQLERCIKVLHNAYRLNTGKEYYVKALCTEGKDRIRWLYRSLQSGYRKAGEDLMQVYWSDNALVNLQTLVNVMEPEACMQMAERQKDKEPLQKEKYLYSKWFAYYKIAASQGYLPAIDAVAVFLYKNEFRECRQIYGEKSQQLKFQEKIANGKNLVEMCQYLIDHGKRPNYYSEIAGVTLFCLNEQHSEAMRYLGGIDTGPANYCKGVMYEFGRGVAKDLNQAMRHYSRAYNNQCFTNLSICRAIERCQNKIVKNQQTHYKNCYSEEKDYETTTSNYQRSSDGCFITTAACVALKKDDDCAELMLLRQFRNEHLQGTVEDQLLVREYYRVGPMIVKKIHQTAHPEKTYCQIWNHFIKPSCEAIKNEQWESGKQIYIDMVKQLCEKFDVKINPNICEIIRKEKDDYSETNDTL